MDTEIVITGLCSILNPFGTTKDMSEPGFIAVNTTHNGHDHHIAYIGYDSRTVDYKGTLAVVPVPNNADFVYLPIGGVELVMDNPSGTPTPRDDSFRKSVAHIHEYWPDSAKLAFDRAYVAESGSRPKKSAVKVWMRFGAGKISASRISEVPWRFSRADGSIFQNNFAEEVVYSFTQKGETVTVQLRDLETGKDLEVLTFTRKSGSIPPLALIIGNDMEENILNSLIRDTTKRVAAPYATHFGFLNRVVGQTDGPLPVVINPPPTGGGGGAGGACGPGSGNGKP